MTGYLIRDIAPVAAISREPERPRDAQDAINGITDIVNRADLADRAPASSTCKRRADQQLSCLSPCVADTCRSPLGRRLSIEDRPWRIWTWRRHSSNRAVRWNCAGNAGARNAPSVRSSASSRARSEEHTSELQSL